MTARLALLAHGGGVTTGVLLAVVGVLLGACVLVLFRFGAALKELRRAADRFAQGDLAQRIAIRGPRRVASLAESLNQMARQLEERLSTVVRQRNEQGAVLSSMVEGVLAIDTDERILSLNSAAARLLELDPAAALGRSIQETVRNPQLQRFVRRALDEAGALEAEVRLEVSDQPGEQTTLQCQSAMLRDAGGERLGAVLVLHDLTRLRKLESVRRDFVANVSHEIRTPISAITASVETMLDESGQNPRDTRRFLQIIARQAERLAAIVEDLLALARIEQDAAALRADARPAPIAPVLAAACETCQSKADARRQELLIECDPATQARIDAQLCEQAIVNLIDNAVKYSPEGADIRIAARGPSNGSAPAANPGGETGGELVITVTDTGRGIEPEHLPRLFERFYRTDRARSRDLGGTGLGLSIVKHIAEAHGGRVSVDSAVGTGSTFRIHLPA